MFFNQIMSNSVTLYVSKADAATPAAGIAKIFFAIFLYLLWIY